MNRRSFLLSSAAGAGGLALGYQAWTHYTAAEARAAAGPGQSVLAGWVKIGTDDSVTVLVPHCDMGQGTHTALAMMLADELDADWDHVRTERAPADKAFANRFLAEGWVLRNRRLPAFTDGVVDTGFGLAARIVNLQITGGSTAVRFTGQVGMRVVGAAARSMLLQAAAREWKVPVRELQAASGVVSHATSGRSARYGELAAAASELNVPASPRLKNAAEFRLIGRAVPRLDIPDKTTGRTRYGIDVRLPGMRYATVRAAPVHGGRLASVNPAAALAQPGVERVIPLDDAVLVVARDYPSARLGLAALQPAFTDGGHGGVTHERLFEWQQRALAEGPSRSLVAIGDAEDLLWETPRERVIERRYRVPMLHHAAMEPINATGQFKDGRLTVWAGEQDALSTRAELAKLSGLPAAMVEFVPFPIGGSYGRRLPKSSHHLVQVVRAAMEMSPHPVKLIWSREEDFAQGSYRPATSTLMRATLSADGKPQAWWQRFVEGVTSPSEGYHLPYGIPHQAVHAVEAPGHVRRGSWRSVNHTQHGFYTESFIDELAHAAGRDPYEYRRDLLPTGSRHRRVLETAAERAGWGGALPPGRGRGIALVESFGSIAAHVIEASVDADGTTRVHRVVAVIDCGGLCHPDTAAQQVEGAVLMGLSAALAEQITLDGGAVVQRGFQDYPLMTMARTPVIEVHFLASDAPWGGLGEPGVPPVAPALCNALFAATGQRVRELPVARTLRPVSVVAAR
ncbi:molybdopterin-dependent oxidoreductase [Schlegelella sp. S2-27]|uniref:Molybdopterin-dependent oxidoreductase n=1 Tax=Caldimonas mangrovi TaxID=2944811 RepID=A0ABT0YJE8_9BURK|nr:molybdopterin cofactor-binding domain-containing protein [Caldimonas mangrovi]MCM5678845.1 molybdopterin-dependent oxidoreductase [Caldimonas mangrovi]